MDVRGSASCPGADVTVTTLNMRVDILPPELLLLLLLLIAAVTIVLRQCNPYTIEHCYCVCLYARLQTGAILERNKYSV
jgi:hypothetical protein